MDWYQRWLSKEKEWIGGLSVGMFISLFYMLILRIGSNPKRYVRQVDAAVLELDMKDEEKKQLAHEKPEPVIMEFYKEEIHNKIYRPFRSPCHFLVNRQMALQKRSAKNETTIITPALYDVMIETAAKS